TFERILSLAKQCRYKDCTHTSETGCAVLEAVEKGEADRSSYENLMKIEREKAHFAATVEERRRKDRIFGKIVRDYKNKDPKQKGM
ncbi:MAG: ribosome small subunit-dependent GTPase A, partial [Bacteroidales bacterium]|nr:ribosome small subunit-dependent GTPase A [Bacteroidales bacterium]